MKFYYASKRLFNILEINTYTSIVTDIFFIYQIYKDRQGEKEKQDIIEIETQLWNCKKLNRDNRIIKVEVKNIYKNKIKLTLRMSQKQI